MSSTTHISPTQDTGGNVNYLPNSCNISDISMISVYWSDIMNKPGFCNVSITGSYNDLLNVPSLSTVAFSGDYNSLSNRPWINSNSNIYNNNQGNVGIGTNNPTEKLHLVGNFSISGDIIPAINSNFNLGSSNYKWKDLYLSGNSIYLDNLIISKNSFNNLEIRDSDNNLRSISLNQLELNDGDNKLRFLYSNGALVFNSNGINIQGIEFSNYSKIIYSNNLYTTSNTIIDYTNYRINNLNFNTGGGGNGATININTDTIQIGTSNKFITSNIYDSNITFMNNLNVNGSYQLNNCNIPFSLMKFTNITTTNGVFTYNDSSNDFGYFSFVNSGTITFPQTTACDVLVVGAGGNGGTGTLSGGGGAGEVIAYPSYSFPSGTYTIQVGTSGTSSNNRISKISSNSVDLLLAKGGADGYDINLNTINNSGGSGGGSYANSNVPSSVGLKWDPNYSYISSGYIGTFDKGGNGGGALSNIGLTTSMVTGTSLTIGEGGSGATSTSTPITKITYGSGGDGNGGTGTNGIVIVKIPLNTCNVKFDGFIYLSNVFDLNYNTITLMSVASNQLNASIVNTSNKLIDYDNLIDKPWINSNLIIYNNNQGNVGIGTNNPSSKLDVNGDINFSGSLRLNQRSLPFSVYSNTNILSSNGLFSYIPNNFFFGYYTYLTNGTITFPQTTSCDIIVVGAGGNGGLSNLSGGGGAGEVIAYQGYSFTTGTYNIQVGTTNDITSSNLRNSTISSNNSPLVTAKGGGDGGYLPYTLTSSGGLAFTSNVINSTTDYYIIFTSNSTILNLNQSLIVDILVVGGGGSGGIRGAGGGGAGAVIYNTNKLLNAGTYTITVGAGGFIIRDIDKTANANGKDTTINYNGTNIYTAKGGGAGGTGTGGGYFGPQNGGSGGGSTYYTTPVGTAFNTENEPDGIYGNSGGLGSAGGLSGAGQSSYAGGGGGGAGSAGTAGVNNTSTNIATGGDGGNGIQIAITGSNIYYGGGGGGGTGVGGARGGYGGLGGGGAGSLSTATASSGLPNTGGGGGGSGFNGGSDGVQGNGGSGVVIIKYSSTNILSTATSGGSGGGGRAQILSNAAVAGTKWDNTYSFVTNGSNGTLTRGGNGGSALSNIGYTETITSNSFVLGVGGLGATSNSVPSLKTTYGSGGDGNGGLGTQGIVIIKVPLNIQRPRFDGYINYSNIDNRPVLNELLSTNNYLNIGYYNQVNFPLGDVSWNNEWFLYIGRSPTSVQNSFIFWHLTSNINSKWWFNGTQTSTNNEISDARIKKEITEIQNPLDKLMLIKPKEYYLCDEKDYLRKYGVIAQDVASNQELSHLVYKDDDFIANVYTTATYVSSPKILLITTTSIIGKVAVDDELKLLLDNMNIENIEIIIEETPYHNRYKKRYVKVKEIIDEFTIEIYEEIELSENEKSNILIYGKKVNDFNKLDYSSLYSLNIACTQELYKIIQEQKNKIDELEQRIIQLENR